MTAKRTTRKTATKSASARKKTGAKSTTRKSASGAKTVKGRTKTAKTTVSKATSATKKRVSFREEVAEAAAAPLAAYNAKRDFSRTKEPAGKVPKKKGKALHFVIQKHEASHLHFDFRLELDGVMKSWAVPKGPSYDPSVRRLAMEVEDHPIEYNKFEGTIPQGEYGGGTVMLWDRGTYDAENGGGVEALRDGYKRGDLKFVLHGERLRGGWVLVRMKRPGRPQWLLIKHRDEFATSDRDVAEEEITSVTTGRTMQEITAGKRKPR
jgi:bifunctional non-homologous end joining protein LigD